MAIVSDRDATNSVFGASFDDEANAMTLDRADALVANACNRDSIDREPRRTDTNDFATVRGGVIKANNVWHTQASLEDWSAPPLASDVAKLVTLDSS